MKIIILGSGTSTGVPLPGCSCAVCTSPDPRNKRLRTSILFEINELHSANQGHPAKGSSHTKNVLVDTSPDLRYQALRAGVKSVDALLFTHAHADHIFGLDDVRGLRFHKKAPLPAYASEACATELKRIFRYAFFPDPTYHGGSAPKLQIFPFEAYKPIQLFGHNFLPLPVLHGKMEVFGFRVEKFAYITDCSSIPGETRGYLADLNFLILSALRERPHPTHFNYEQAIEEVEKVQPRHAYFIHTSHENDHEHTNEKLRKMTNLKVELAYDGLVIEI